MKLTKAQLAAENTELRARLSQALADIERIKAAPAPEPERRGLPTTQWRTKSSQAGFVYAQCPQGHVYRSNFQCPSEGHARVQARKCYGQIARGELNPATDWQQVR